MNIILSSDEKGVDMLSVAVYSVAKSHNDVNIKFHILHAGIETSSQNRIKRLASEFENILIHFIQVDESRINGLVLSDDPVPIASYFRYLAPELLPNEDRALYMDIDMLCIGRLDKMYRDTSMGEHIYLAAVEDFFVSTTDDYPGIKKGIGLAEADKYFNTGLLLMNLSALRDGIMEEFWATLRTRSKEIPKEFDVFADQTSANIVFRQKTKFLPGKFNVLTSAMKYKKYDSITIVHFAGPDKPFTYRDEYSAVYDDAYFTYYEECMSIIGENDNLMIKNTLRRLGKESSDAIRELVEKRKIASDKTNHVKELIAERDSLIARVYELGGELERVRNSKTWRLANHIHALRHPAEAIKRTSQNHEK